MSVYVDPLFVGIESDAQAARVGARNGHQWSHMWADTEEELDQFAAQLGMKLVWKQDQGRAHGKLIHYDLTPSRRARAVKLGAVEITVREWLRAKRAEIKAQ